MKTRYRIVGSADKGYKPQYRPALWPFWLDMYGSYFHSLPNCEEFIRHYAWRNSPDPVVKELGELP